MSAGNPEQLQKILENITDIVMLVDKNGTILYINHTLPNFTPEKVIGTSAFTYIPAGDHQIMQAALQKVFSGEPNEYQITGVGPNGSTSWYKTYVSPIKSPDGQVESAVMISRDVTAHMISENELTKAQKIVTDQEMKISQLQEQVTKLQNSKS